MKSEIDDDQPYSCKALSRRSGQRHGRLLHAPGHSQVVGTHPDSWGTDGYMKAGVWSPLSFSPMNRGGLWVARTPDLSDVNALMTSP